jgi:putative ABC transport system substrate-binding protein
MKLIRLTASATLVLAFLVAALAAEAQHFTERRRVADLAITHRLPTMLDARDFVEAGGLMSYGLRYDDLYRRGAIYVRRSSSWSST